jgi:glucose/arabinose dehydrogenase
MGRYVSTIACAAVVLIACNGAPDLAAAQTRPYTVTAMADFDQPWAMTFLPSGELLVTEMRGKLHVYRPEGERHEISGIPEVAFGGQGGLGDIILHPAFAENSLVYLSYAEPGDGPTRGAAVARARLERHATGGGRLTDLQVLWQQVPKVTGQGHYAHRLRFGPDGYLWITSGDRQKLDPAQDMQSNLGKVLRLNEDGSVPDDNPFASQGGVAAQIWSFGHRNPLGLVFDAAGRLWVHEMGPRGGDELNRIERGANYGWPIVSHGRHYDGTPIPAHSTRPEFKAPVISWTPVISPAGFIIYSGSEFPQWQGSGFIGGLSSRGLVRLTFDGDRAREAERFDLGERIREVEQGPDGAIWLLEDGRRGGGGRLLRLTAAR